MTAQSAQGAPVVCLDPGHDNRHYNQSPVVPAYYEGQRMWDLALLLKSRLEERGITVRMTKAQVDQVIDLVPRGRMSQGAALFLSLHSNAAATPQPNWVLALHQVAGKQQAMSEQSRELAGLLAPAAAQVMGTTYQISALQSSQDRDGDGYRDDYYGVLRGAAAVGTPGVILEHGFHTNRENAQWLLSDANLEKLAQREAEVIAEWLNVRPTQERWYRIRKSWSDAAGQLGAYRELTYAKNACPVGYTVFDWNGNPVYRPDDGLAAFVRQIQQAVGAAVDGIPGPETLGKTPTVSAAANPRHGVVRPVQQRLAALGYSQVGAADGIAGPKFTAAVKAFQKAEGCVEDGELTAGNRTWKRLLGMD